MKSVEKKRKRSVLPMFLVIFIGLLTVCGIVIGICYVNRSASNERQQEPGWTPFIWYNGVLYKTEPRMPVLMVSESEGLQKVGKIEKRVDWYEESFDGSQTNGDLVGTELFQFPDDPDHLYIKPRYDKNAAWYETYVVGDKLWDEIIHSSTK